jgi:hypothetical protein
MNIETHNFSNSQIAIVTSDKLIINTTDDGLDLIGNLYYQGFDSVVIFEQNITKEFFELKNGMAGEILQKFSNYRINLAIVGDFTKFESKSLLDFIYESNKRKQINFVSSIDDALDVLST